MNTIQSQTKGGSAERPELLPLIPRSARRVLDVGCGSGQLGAALKRLRPEVHVTGIEISPEKAAAARERLDTVIEGDAAAVDLSGHAPFDCLIYADSLEHVTDPLAMLTNHLRHLTPEGRVAASIPNVQHHSIIRMLLAGRWDAREYGLCDRTHLRFFTRKSIRTLFEEAGLEVEILERGWSRAARILSLLTLGLFAGFLTYQYRLRARIR